MARGQVAPEGADYSARMLRKFNARDMIDEDEAQVLRDCIKDVREFAPGKTIIRAGAATNECMLLVDGLVCRFKDLADGQRQILELHVPGDFLDLHSFLLKRLEHNVAAVNKVRLAIVPHESLRCITEQYPHLTRILWFSTVVDAAINRESILSVGRRSAIARVAHLFCEINMRLELVGIAEQGRFPLPMTQIDIADATGLTSVHVNRMLKKLRNDDVLTFRGGEAAIHDWAQLQRIAEFDPTYLYLERRPR